MDSRAVQSGVGWPCGVGRGCPFLEMHFFPPPLWHRFGCRPLGRLSARASLTYARRSSHSSRPQFVSAEDVREFIVQRKPFLISGSVRSLSCSVLFSQQCCFHGVQRKPAPESREKPSLCACRSCCACNALDEVDTVVVVATATALFVTLAPPEKNSSSFAAERCTYLLLAFVFRTHYQVSHVSAAI